MGIRTGLGILIGVMPILLYIFHDPSRDFIHETVEAGINGLRSALG
jgi:uncharacterized NAD-dependent epimerase/dehydratase family protein